MGPTEPTAASLINLIVVIVALSLALCLGLATGLAGIGLTFWPPAPRLAHWLQGLTVGGGVIVALASIPFFLAESPNNTVALGLLLFGATLALLGGAHWPIVFALSKRNILKKEKVSSDGK
jgi:hypothetical protein